jgi:N-acetylmuramoyl-L-alanine amidase
LRRIPQTTSALPSKQVAQRKLSQFQDAHHKILRSMRRVIAILMLAVGFATLALAKPRGFDLPHFWHEKEKYVALRDLAAAYDMDFKDPVMQRITLQNRSHTLTFKIDSRELTVDGILVWLHAPMELVKNRWAIREVDARIVVDPLIRPDRHLFNVGHRTVVIDPGHGGQDIGAKGRRGVEEKRVVLDLSRRLRAHLMNAGVRVRMTRESDRFIELDERSRLAARWGADLFVSIHLNSAPSPTPSGVETFVLAAAGYESTGGGLSHVSQPGNRFEAANAVAAYQIQRALVKRLGSTDRGVKRSRFIVLKNAPCPAVLVECAFVSNPTEEAKLLVESHREAMAESMARGVLNYLKLVRRAKAQAESK